MFIKKINELRREFLGKYFKPITEDDLIEISQPNTQVVVIEDREIRAMAFVYHVRSLTRSALVFEEFMVDPDYRNQGYGQKLMDKIIELAKELKVDCIECCVREGNVPARNLYFNNGFRNRENLAVRKWM